MGIPNFLYSSFAFVGLLPFYIEIALYENVFQEKPYIVDFHIINYSGNWSLYIMFCLSNFVIYSLLIWKDERKNI